MSTSVVLRLWSHGLYHNDLHTTEPLLSRTCGWTTRLSINSRRAAGRLPDAGNDLQCVTGRNSSVTEGEGAQGVVKGGGIFQENMFTMAASNTGWAANDTTHEQKQHSRACVRNHAYSLNVQFSKHSSPGHSIKTGCVYLQSGVQGLLGDREVFSSEVKITIPHYRSQSLKLMALNKLPINK